MLCIYHFLNAFTYDRNVVYCFYSLCKKSINSLVDFFRPPKEVHLEQITSATLNKLEEFRDKTSTGKLLCFQICYTH